MTESLRKTRATYNKVARSYFDRRQDRSAMAPLIDHFTRHLSPGVLILDVGCGPGFESDTLR